MERHEKRIACVLSLEAKTLLICINAKKIRKCLRWGGGYQQKQSFVKRRLNGYQSVISLHSQKGTLTVSSTKA